MKNVLLIVTMVLGVSMSFAAQVQTKCEAANGYSNRSIAHQKTKAPSKTTSGVRR